MTIVHASAQEDTIQIYDGRSLSSLEVGNPTGTPSFYFPVRRRDPS